jgi:hypothetical protein
MLHEKGGNGRGRRRSECQIEIDNVTDQDPAKFSACFRAGDDRCVGCLGKIYAGTELLGFLSEVWNGNTGVCMTVVVVVGFSKEKGTRSGAHTIIP